MKIRLRILITILSSAALLAAFWLLIRDNAFDVLEPAGWVAAEQRNILIFASLLSLVVIVPVFALTAYIVWNYRETHPHPPRFDPTFQSSRNAELIWWGVPVILIAILGVVIWISSHRLDPYKPLTSDKQPLTVQVIAMNWKWLFIYPEQGVASVNYLQIPVGRPINFQLTGDAPMTSFWIPKLGGQVYAMSGMTTKLHLQADQPGVFTGRNANISGEGYSGMTFSVRADTDDAFDEWVEESKSEFVLLDESSYEELAKPTKDVQPQQYVLASASIFDSVVMKYMSPKSKNTPAHDTPVGATANEHSDHGERTHD